MTRKRTINTILAGGHHIETWQTATNLFFSTYQQHAYNYTICIIFLTGEDELSQDRFPAIQALFVELPEDNIKAR
jgi:hypothetical protein